MKETFCMNEQFTFHSSWISAMSYIASKAVRNRLMASIIEYGLNSRHVPVGNATADAILSIAMDQIDRECGRKTRREEYAERVRASRDEEQVKEQAEEHDMESDEKPVGNVDESEGESDVGSNGEAVTEPEPEIKAEPEPEQKASSINLPEKKPLEDDAAVRECMTGSPDSHVLTDRSDRIVNGGLYRLVKHNNETISKKNNVRPHRWRRR